MPLTDTAICNAKPGEKPVKLFEALCLSGSTPQWRPMSDNAILAALRRMGFAKEEMSGHGFWAKAGADVIPLPQRA